MKKRDKTIFRTTQTDNVTEIKNAYLQDARLSYAARGLFAYVLSQPTTPLLSMDSLASVGDKKRVSHVRSLVKELTRHGYLKLNTYRDASSGKLVGKFYSIPEEICVPIKKTKHSRYVEYLRSDHWLIIREEVKKRDGFKCQMCQSEQNLEVHHKTYKHIGNEQEHMEDLITLCHECHHREHFPANPLQ